EGLEAAEIKLTELERTMRIDSEYFRQEHLVMASVLRQIKTVSIAQSCVVSDGNHFSISDDFVDQGIPYYRGQDVAGHFFVEQSNPVSITEAAYDRKFMRRSYLQKGDVLLSIVGTIGESSLVMRDRKATCSCKLAILRPGILEPSYLAAFLRSKYGRDQTRRLTRGAVQMGLILEDLDQALVPNLSEEIQDKISDTTLAAWNELLRGERFKDNAEIQLLDLLGLQGWQSPEPLSYIRPSSEAFAAGRFDAEYFYPAKTAALSVLGRLSDFTIGDLFDSVRNLWQPSDGQATDKVRNYDLTDALNPFLDGCKEAISRESIASTKKIILAGDLVVSRLRSYLKEIAIVQPSEGWPMVASTEFIVLRPKATVLPVEALLIYLRSALPQLVFKWSQDGSNHPRFDERELLNLPVPRVLIEQANIFVLAVHSMINARQRANQLLDAAKRAVEIAIESSESDALVFLDRTLAETGAVSP
ncbi:MAG: hypothetical protein RLZZ09_2724, partial [Pseudomonadota bacterium]